ncbi:MAG: hypothetical protein KF842_14700 [Caulobacter sp.]|nr:hypothetical protein [Caulobacter sp.]
MAAPGIVLAIMVQIENQRLAGDPAALDALLVEVGAHCRAEGDLAALLDALSLVASLAVDGSDEGRRVARFYRRFAHGLRKDLVRGGGRGPASQIVNR